MLNRDLKGELKPKFNTFYIVFLRSLTHIKLSFGGYLCLLRFFSSIIWFEVEFFPLFELKHCGLVIIVSGL